MVQCSVIQQTILYCNVVSSSSSSSRSSSCSSSSSSSNSSSNIEADVQTSAPCDAVCNGQQVCFASNRLPLDRLVGPVVKASASRAEDPGFESRLRRDFFRGRVIPVTSKLALQWLPCQAPDVIGQRWDWLDRCQYTVTG